MKLKFLISLFSVLIFVQNVEGQIINVGEFVVKDGTLITFSEAFSNAETANYLNDGIVVFNSDLSFDGVVETGSGLSVFESAINDVQHIIAVKDSIYFNRLEINNSLKGVAIPDGYIVVVNEGIHLIDGSLRLLGTSELIQNGNGTNPNTANSGVIEKKEFGVSSGYAYNYWSSPVSTNGTFALGDVLYDGSDASLNTFNAQKVGFTGSLDSSPSVLDGDGSVVVPLKVSSRWLYQFIDNNKGYSGWMKIDKNSPMKPGEGFTMKGSNTLSAEQNYVFKGVPNSGDYSIEINENNVYLIGNPYPSSMDAEAFITENQDVFDELYFWVDGGTNSHYLSNYQGGYATYNLTAGAPVTVPPPGLGGIGDAVVCPDDLIAVGQGFFVTADGPVTEIKFKNDQRVFRNELGILSMPSKEELHSKNTFQKDKKSIIRLGFKDVEGFTRQLVLGFVPNKSADINYNRGYDAQMYDARPDEVFFTIVDAPSQKFVIQGVGAFDENYEIPLGIQITQAGNQQFFIEGLENFFETVYLKDNYTATTYELSEDAFELDLVAGTYEDRYALVFKPSNKSDFEDALKNSINVYFSEDELILENIHKLPLTRISITNLLGQNIYETFMNEDTSSRISIPFQQSNAVYFIQVYSESAATSFKRLKK